MTYRQAKRQILRNRLLGYPLLVVTSTSTAISALKLFYVGLNATDAVSTALAPKVQHLVGLIYENTQFLEYFWRHSPLPTLQMPLNVPTMWVIVIYGLTFVALALLGSATALSKRLAKIDLEIENEMLRASVRKAPIRRREDIEDSVPVGKPSLFEKLHAMYFAPIIGGLIVAAIAKKTGLV